MRKLRGLSAALVGAAMAFTLLGAVAPTASAADGLALQGPQASTYTAPAKVIKTAKVNLRSVKKELRHNKKTTIKRSGKQLSYADYVALDRARTCLRAAKSYASGVKGNPSRAITAYNQTASIQGCRQIKATSQSTMNRGQLAALTQWSSLPVPESLPAGPRAVANTPAELKELLTQYPDMPQEAKDGYLMDFADGYIVQVRRAANPEFIIRISITDSGDLVISHGRGGRNGMNICLGSSKVFSPGEEADASAHLGMSWSSERPADLDGTFGPDAGTPDEHGLRTWWGTLDGDDTWSATFYG